MGRIDQSRWTQNPDGSHTRRRGNAAAVAEVASSGSYADLKVPELKAELKKRGLPVSGKKPELVARLEATGE